MYGLLESELGPILNDKARLPWKGHCSEWIPEGVQLASVRDKFGLRPATDIDIQGLHPMVKSVQYHDGDGNPFIRINRRSGWSQPVPFPKPGLRLVLETASCKLRKGLGNMKFTSTAMGLKGFRALPACKESCRLRHHDVNQTCGPEMQIIDICRQLFLGSEGDEN